MAVVPVVATVSVGTRRVLAAELRPKPPPAAAAAVWLLGGAALAPAVELMVVSSTEGEVVLSCVSLDNVVA